MEFADLIALPDSEKVCLTEINIGDQVDDETWTQVNPGVSNTWYLSYSDGTVNKVEENGVAYTERFSSAAVEASASSFYYDFENQRLYVHASGSNNPGAGPYGGSYTIIVYFWLYFSNEAFTGSDAVIFPRQTKALTDGGFEIWNQSATDLVNWSEATAGGSTVNRESSTVYDGGYCVRLDVDAGNADVYVYQDIILPPRARCKIKFWYLNSVAAKTGWLSIIDSANNVYLDSSAVWQAGATVVVLPNQTSWTEYELEFYAHKDYTNYRITFRRGAAASSSIYYDKASLTIYMEDNLYLPYIASDGVPTITQAVADYYTGGMTRQFGRVKFNDDGWWFPMLDNYLWLNKESIIRLGAKGSDFDDFEKIFTGRVENYSISDTSTEIEVLDERATLFQEIPTDQYWVADYANLKSGAEGKSIPILYGYKTNITPIEIDTAARKFKICGHRIQALNAVYDNGVLQGGGGVDYNADLPNGEFTFTHAYTGPITCDTTGKLCDWEDGTYSNNVADILWDLVANENGISEELIDFKSLLDLKAGRTQQHALYIDTPQDTLEIIRLLQASALFHFIPLLDGTFGAFRFKTETEGLPVLYDEDYDYFKIEYEPSVYRHVRIKYDEDPTDGDWLSVIRSEDDVSYKYKEENTLTIETSLTQTAEAQTLGDWYVDSLENPPKKVETSIPTVGFDKIPSERFIINKTRLDAEGDTVTICDEEVYSILELRKNLLGRVGLVAQDASQVSELAHSDAHTDTAHVDNHTDDHVDGGHSDTHTDTAHVDDYTDTAYVDTPHTDTHEDSHIDEHEDHTDGPHDDTHDDSHYDSHADTAHTDTAHVDSHTDTAYVDEHGDGGYTDTHEESYEDVPHQDSHSDS